MKLVFIHGRSQQGKDPIELKLLWEKTLKKGMENAGLQWPQNIDIAFPFYGDNLDELITELDAPLVDDVIFRGSDADSSEASFRGELLYEIAQNSGVTDAEIQSNYEGDLRERGPQNWGWVQAILRTLDKTIIGELTLDNFARDVYVYLTNKAVQREIHQIITPHLDVTPCVVVGHSLGSVIAYNILKEATPALPVIKYISIGSPLGIKTVKRQLDTPLVMPKCLRQGWYNAMDKKDAISLHPLDEENFPIDPSILNYTGVNNHTDNRHSINGYLDDPDVASQIYQALTS